MTGCAGCETCELATELAEERSRTAELEAEIERLEAHNDELRGERDRASGMLRDSETQLRRAQGARDAARKNARESAAAKARDRVSDLEEAIELMLCEIEGIEVGFENGCKGAALMVAKKALGIDETLAPCPDCEGTGHGEALGDMSGYIPCGTCGGTGKIDAEDARRYRANRAALASREQLDTKEDR